MNGKIIKIVNPQQSYYNLSIYSKFWKEPYGADFLLIIFPTINFEKENKIKCSDKFDFHFYLQINFINLHPTLN